MATLKKWRKKAIKQNTRNSRIGHMALQAVGTSMKRSYKSGKAKGSHVVAGSVMSRDVVVSKKNSTLNRGAAAAGRSVRKMTAAKKAALKKAQQASARARKKFK